jgi:hypothetical protein
VKSAGLDFIHNLLSDIDAITPLKKIDNYDHIKDILASSKLNSIYISNQMHIGVSKTVLEDKCNELMKLKGPLFASQLSMIILDAVKIAFSKEYDPLGFAVKQVVKKAESEIPRSSFKIAYAFNYDNDIAGLVDFLYTARSEAAIQIKYSILVEFISNLVNVVKIRRNIEITNDSILLNKVAFGSTGQPVTQIVKKKEIKQKESPPVPLINAEQPTQAPRPPVEKQISAPAADSMAAAKDLPLTKPAIPVPVQAAPKPTPVEAPIPQKQASASNKTIKDSALSKQIEPVPKVETARAILPAKKLPADSVHSQAPVKAVSEPTQKDNDPKEASLAIRLKPRSEYANVGGCIEANIGTVVSLSAGYGTMDVVMITKYLCEGIFLAGTGSGQTAAKYSGYESCVEKNMGTGDDRFSQLKEALGYCDGLFGIKDR